MKKKLFIILFLVLLSGGTRSSAYAEEALFSPHDQLLLALINEARRSPLTVAASYGMDTVKILNDFPEMEKILKEGLPPLAFNAQLAEAARAHTTDMFAGNYYSHLSPDGRNYDERIKETGYPAVLSGESLGMIFFGNFIAPADAVRIIFQYMFTDELSPSRTEKRMILDPDLRDAGVSVSAGALTFGKSKWNVYLATCDYGSILSSREAKLLEMINEARQNPLAVAASLGMDPEKILADLPEMRDLLTGGLLPLTANADLARAARAHSEDMRSSGYYSSVSLDGRTVYDRVLQAGYDAANVGESLGWLPLGGDDVLVNEFLSDNERSDAIIRQLFESIFTRELMPQNTVERNILNASLRDVGIGFATGMSPELGGICLNRLVFLAVDFGVRAEVRVPLQN